MPSPYDDLLQESQSENDQVYHGTQKTAAETIVREGFINDGNGEDLYLGKGVYFFNNQHSEAQIWAKRYRKYSPWAVIRATIRLGFCVNLDEQTHRDALTNLASRLRKSAASIPDAVVINALALLTQVDSVTATRRKRNAKPYRDGSEFEEGNQLIICVRNLHNIVQCEVAYTGA